MSGPTPQFPRALHRASVLEAGHILHPSRLMIHTDQNPGPGVPYNCVSVSGVVQCTARTALSRSQTQPQGGSRLLRTAPMPKTTEVPSPPPWTFIRHRSSLGLSKHPCLASPKPVMCIPSFHPREMLLGPSLYRSVHEAWGGHRSLPRGQGRKHNLGPLSLALPQLSPQSTSESVEACTF